MKNFLAVTFATTVFSVSGYATPIAVFDFESNDVGDSFPFDDSVGAAGVTVSQLVVGGTDTLAGSGAGVTDTFVFPVTAGGSTDAGTKFLQLSPFQVVSGAFSDDLTPGSEDGTSFLTFSVTPDAGNQIVFESISLDRSVARTDNAQGILRTEFFFSLDDGTTFIELEPGNPQSLSIDGPANSGLVTVIDDTLGVLETPQTGTVLFALSLNDNSGLSLTTVQHGFDNLIVEGTVSPVPEPGSLLLLGMGSALLLRRKLACVA